MKKFYLSFTLLIFILFIVSVFSNCKNRDVIKCRQGEIISGYLHRAGYLYALSELDLISEIK